MRNHNYHTPVVDQDRFLNRKLHPHIKSIVERCPSAENPESSRSDAALTCWKAASRQPLHPPALPVLRTALAFNRPLAPLHHSWCLYSVSRVILPPKNIPTSTLADRVVRPVLAPNHPSQSVRQDARLNLHQGQIVVFTRPRDALT